MHRSKSDIDHESLITKEKNAISALNELMKDSYLNRHHKSLHDITKTISRAIDSDNKWSIKCQKLKTELAVNEIKVKTAIRLSEEEKNVIDTLKEELQTAWGLIEEFKNNKASFSICKNVMSPDAGTEANESVQMAKKLIEQKSRLTDEIEKGKLLVFEFEEEMTKKENSIEDLTNVLRSKTKLLEQFEKENEELKVLLDETRKSDTINDNSKTICSDEMNSKPEEVSQSGEMLILLKQLRNVNKRNEITVVTLNHVVKKNNILTRELRKANNHANLLNLQLKGQMKMLDLLSSQCCKLEERDIKQVRIINELESIRNNYTRMIGSLEQEVHELKKEIKTIQ